MWKWDSWWQIWYWCSDEYWSHNKKVVGVLGLNLLWLLAKNFVKKMKIWFHTIAYLSLAKGQDHLIHLTGWLWIPTFSATGRIHHQPFYLKSHGDHFLTVVSRDYPVHCSVLLSHLWLIRDFLSFFSSNGICILPSLLKTRFKKKKKTNIKGIYFILRWCILRNKLFWVLTSRF